MMITPRRVLFASRAYESPDSEGGFLILKDLAMGSADDPDTQAAFLSTCQHGETSDGVELLPAYSRSGWTLRLALQFAFSLRSQAAKFDIVHTAHVPTSLNTNILRRICRHAKPRGTRFVQTVTALPMPDDLRPEMFWGDAVVCLNEAAAEMVRQFHDNVSVISPVPRQTRLVERMAAPADIRQRLAGQKVVCFPIDLQRVSADFDLHGLCKSLLERRNDTAVVFACRFGEEQIASRTLATLVETYAKRVHVFGMIDWMLDLLAMSDVVVYPIDDQHKKFNPPMILLEASALGSQVVTATSVQLDSLLLDGTSQQLASNHADDWSVAVLDMVNADIHSGGAAVSFDEVYLQYTRLYCQLQDQTER